MIAISGLGFSQNHAVPLTVDGTTAPAPEHHSESPASVVSGSRRRVAVRMAARIEERNLVR
jgi:hypothetical protein